VFNQIHHFIHFNLSLSLLLGLVLFVSGIETAKDSQVSLRYILRTMSVILVVVPI